MADLIKNRCHVEILMNVEQLVLKTASAQSDSFNKYEVCNMVVTTTVRHLGRHVSVWKGASRTDTSGFLFMSVGSRDLSRLHHSHLISRVKNTAGSRQPGYPHSTGEGKVIDKNALMMMDGRGFCKP